MGVTTVADLSRSSDFRLLGDLNNFGNLQVVSSDGRTRGGAIRAEDIYNQSGATITSKSDLTLDAAHNFANRGEISSEGSLSIIAGDSVHNSSSISAARNLNINSASVLNGGKLVSASGDINFSAPATLNIDNQAGTITVHAGAINVRETNYSAPFDTTISGGDWFGPTVNLNAGAGSMTMDVGQLTAAVNQTGHEIHLSASTDMLTLGHVCLTGDPTFKNDAGSINVAGNLQVGESLAIIASGDVTSAGGTIIQAASSTSGFDITILAGAAQLAGGTNSSTLPGGGTASATTVTGLASATGGSVSLGTNCEIRTRSLGKKGDGGNVLIAAFAGGNLGSGQVNLTDTSILTGGRTKKDDNGQVKIVAGFNGANAISLGTIDSAGPNPSGGDITIKCGQPVSSNGQNVVFNASGQITSGNSITGGSLIVGHITLGNDKSIVSNSDVSIQTFGSIVGASSGLGIVQSNHGDVFITASQGILTQATGGTAFVTQDTLNIQTPGGDVGTGASPVFFNAEHLNVASGGAVFLENFFPVKTAIHVDSLVADSSISLKSSDGVNIEISNGTAVSSAVGSVDIALDGAGLILEENSSITAKAGISLTTGSSSKDKITFKEGAGLFTTGGVGGNISVVRGTLSATPAPTPKNVTVAANVGTILFTGAKTKGQKPTSTLTSNDGNINISTDKNNKIILKGTTITTN